MSARAHLTGPVSSRVVARPPHVGKASGLGLDESGLLR